MGLFKNNPQGGVMDVIRCDETSYLVWKWHPAGTAEGTKAKENSIRWGSSLRVKNGEAAVFVYHNNGKLIQDHILGPYDSILKTENLPLITSAIGLAYNGNTPFQAEVYFINLSQILQVKVGVPYFDVADSRFPDRGVPTSVRGVIGFKIADPFEFVDKYQLRTVSLEEFKSKIKAAAIKYVKNVVANAPDEYGIPVTQLEKKILEINEIIEKNIKKRLKDEFGVTVTSVDISDIEIDKNSVNYKFLLKKSDVGVNIGVAAQVRNFVASSVSQAASVATEAASEIIDTGISKAASVAELATDAATAAVDVKEYQYATRKKTQSGFVKSFFKGGGDLSSAEKKPSFSSNITKGVTDFVSGIGSTIRKSPKEEQVPPPIISYYVAIDGKPEGPFSVDELNSLAAQETFAADSLVWKKGMDDWTKAKDVEELAPFFESDGETIPPLPPL